MPGTLLVPFIRAQFHSLSKAATSMKSSSSKLGGTLLIGFTSLIAAALVVI